MLRVPILARDTRLKFLSTILDDIGARYAIESVDEALETLGVPLVMIFA